MYGSAVSANLVHHIQRQHHRSIQLHKLHGEIEVSLYIGGVNDVDYTGGFFIKYELPGYDFLAGVGGKGVYSRKVRYQCIRMFSYGSAFLIYRYTRKISHVLVRARKLVEKGRLAAVLISCQCKGKLGSLRQRIFVCFRMVLSPFSKARVLRSLYGGLFISFCFSCLFLFRNLHRLTVSVGNLNFFCVGKSERQLISVYQKLHWVPHRSVFYQCYLGSRYHSHVKEMLPE